MPDIFVLSVVVFLSWLLVFAGIHKLKNADYYAGILSDYLPVLFIYPFVLNALRVLLGVAEVLLAISLLIEPARPVALFLTAILLLIYAAAMAAQMMMGRKDIACGCAGPAAQTSISAGLVIRNIVLSSIIAITLFLPKQAMPMDLSAMTVSLSAAAFFIVLYMSSEQMISNAQKFSS